MSELKLDTSVEKVAYIMDKIPQARHNYLLLLLSYWQLFDGIDIPKDMIHTIAENATQPETVGRSRRKAVEADQYKQLLELKRLVEGKELVKEEPQTN